MSILLHALYNDLTSTRKGVDMEQEEDMGHLAAFKKQLHDAIDAAGRRADVAKAEKDLARLTAESERASAARAALPAGSSRARVTTANARWARKAEAREMAARRLAALKEEP